MLKGGKHSEETRKKMSLSWKMGRKQWHTGTKGLKPAPKTAFKKGNIPWNKGKKLSSLHKKHLSNGHKGRISPRKGKECPQFQWQNHPRFRGGVSGYNKRDNQVKHLKLKPICEICGKSGFFGIGSIEVHHIDKDRSNNKPDNVMALCVLHHKRVDRGKILCPR